MIVVYQTETRAQVLDENTTNVAWQHNVKPLRGSSCGSHVFSFDANRSALSAIAVLQTLAPVGIEGITVIRISMIKAAWMSGSIMEK
ncbi:hypothetical protein [Chromobacterium sphagni]|uniref:hypothetical protein n=1 Tax=Chromobacterium sphagni TaxID=1903179 RepID=UPI0011145ADC|nr:hypothetical protein [Chromobacterium sphagni]